MKKLMLALLFACTPVMAQDAVMNTSTNALMNAVIMDNPAPLFIKNSETHAIKPAPKATVTIDKVSKFPNKSRYDQNVYVYPITVKGTPCVVVTTYQDGLAISCGWK